MTISDDPLFTIRYLEESDGPTLSEWLALDEIRPFFACETKDEIDLMKRIWISYSRYKCGLTALYDGKPCGIAILFLMPYRKVSHHCMAYVIVPPEFQKKGVGTALVANVLNLAKNYFRQERVHFEVFGDSPLLSILEKQGCDLIAKQEGYIKMGDYFAPRILMEKVYI